MSQPPNIYIIGAQCTGKTTLVKNLHANFESNSSHEPPILITEVARTVLKQHSFTAADVVNPDSIQLQSLILQAQASAERQVTQTGQWFISDRSGADPIAYALRYVEEGRANQLIQSDEWRELRTRMQDAIVVVFEASEEARSWLADDGVRLIPEDVDDWIAMHRVFCEFLQDQEMNFQVLPAWVGDHEERVEFVLQCWDCKKERGPRWVVTNF
ncbi:Putative protein of unknown function [Podospora comata]|uniref:NadR/Ttd14 AAA domain-containing protein n=1 Tax=Podospora comata TaxID=48703 RepID=A0ABY6SF43_PODCO|nr:Putative protein of unknown function [Podospora comata]